MDPGLNQLLKWGIENSTTSAADGEGEKSEQSAEGRTSTRGLDPKVLASILGGPSDAELMKASMDVIRSDSATVEEKLTAFDNLEQLIESLDNANLLAPLDLWRPLFDTLKSSEPQLRFFGAWCVGTAIQNNPPAQEAVLKMGGVPALVQLCLEDGDDGVRKKAIYALSSEVRNHQPAADALSAALPEHLRVNGWAQIDASDMAQIDRLMSRLREQGKEGTS